MAWSEDIEEGIKAIRALDGQPRDIPRESIEKTIDAANRTLSLYFGEEKQDVDFMDLWLHTQDDITRLQEALNRALMREEIALRHSWRSSSIDRHTQNITEIRDLQNKITTFEGKLRTVASELRQNEKLRTLDQRLSGLSEMLRTTSQAVAQLQFDVGDLKFWNAVQRVNDPELQDIEELDAGKVGLKLAADNTVFLSSQLLAYYIQVQTAMKSLESEAPRMIEGVDEFEALKGSLSREIREIKKWLEEMDGATIAELDAAELDAKVSALITEYADIQVKNQMVQSVVSDRMLESPTGSFVVDYLNYSVPAKALAGMGKKVHMTNADIEDVAYQADQRRSGIEQLIEQGSLKAKEPEVRSKSKGRRKDAITHGYKGQDDTARTPLAERTNTAMRSKNRKKSKGAPR